MSEFQRPLSSSTPALLVWLDVLLAIFPPRGVLLVGAGTGNSSWVRWLKTRHISSVCLVEGNERQYRHLRRQLHADSTSGLLNGLSDWIPRQEVLSERQGQVTFYEASNPAESGLVNPELLRELWPSLATERAVMQEAITLDALQEEAGLKTNWLLLDCLPAAELLQGSEKFLSTLDLALVRVTMDQHKHDIPSSGQDAVDMLMRKAGLVRVHLEPERHPALAHALYTRSAQKMIEKLDTIQQHASKSTEQLRASQDDWEKERTELTRSLDDARIKAQQAIEELKISQDEKSKSFERLQAIEDNWANERAKSERRLNESRVEIQKATNELNIFRQEKANSIKQFQAAEDSWTKERVELTRKLDEARSGIQKMTEELRTLQQDKAKSAEERQTTQNNWTQERAKLTQALDLAKTGAHKATEELRISQERAAKLTEELRVSRDEWSKEKSLLTGTRTKAEELATERQTKLKASEQQVVQLQRRLSEAERSNLLLRAEIEKAEAQIELIREFLKLQAKI